MYNTFMIWFFYCFQVLLILFTILVVMIQKSADNAFSASKVFGLRGRSNGMIKLTYVLFFLFVVNNIILCILYKKKQARIVIKEVPECVVQPVEAKKEETDIAKNNVKNDSKKEEAKNKETIVKSDKQSKKKRNKRRS